MQVKNATLIRYLLAGGLSFAIELAVLFSLKSILSLSAEAATAIAFWVGFLAAFVLQKFFAFKDYEKTVKSISAQMVSYVILVVFNYLVTIFIVSSFDDDMVLVSRTLAIILTTLWNFLIYKKLIFKSK